MAEFEVRAGSIRQEILNATKDKADKTLVVAEAGKIREEFSNLRVGGRNLIRNYDWNGLLPLLSNQVGWKFERVEDQFAKSGYMLKATCTRAGNGGFYKTFFDLRANEFQGKDMTWSWDIKSSRPITFYDMGQHGGNIDAAQIMVGLALALKATALGILVAIPSIMFYNMLSRKVDIRREKWLSYQSGNAK